jgi:RNA-directed DNA polymerase
MRVLDGVTSFVEKRLKLRVNAAKSAVAPATKRGLLGFGFMWRNGSVKVRIDAKAKKSLKARIRKLTARTWGISMTERISILNRFIRGWCAYFALADTYSVFDELDEWLRRRLRQVRWKEWKRPATRAHNLRRLGIERQKAYEWGFSRKGAWRIAGSAPLQRGLPNAYWRTLGLVGFSASYGRMRQVWRTA